MPNIFINVLQFRGIIKARFGGSMRFFISCSLLFRNYHCGEEYLRKAFTNVNEQFEYREGLRRGHCAKCRLVFCEKEHFRTSVGGEEY